MKLSLSWRVALFTILLCSLLMNTAEAQSDRALRVSFVAAIAAHTSDISTTAFCLGQGTCREVNPALKWASDRPLALGLTKGAIAGALQLIPYHLQKRGHPKMAFWFNVAQSVAFTYIAVRNARLAR